MPPDDPGVGAENVHRAVAFQRGDHERVHVALLPDVAAHPQAADAGGDRQGVLLVQVGADHAARAFLGKARGERIVAANVDQVLVVFAAAKPEPHVRMLDRFLVIAEGNETS